MPYCPICKCDYDDTASACPICGNDLIDTPDDMDDGFDTGDSESGSGIVDLDEAILIYRSYSRLNTDFLVETLKSAGIPHYCKIVGGFYGRGMKGSVGFFGVEATDAEIFVPPEYEEDAMEIKRQTVGDDD